MLRPKALIKFSVCESDGGGARSRGVSLNVVPYDSASRLAAMGAGAVDGRTIPPRLGGFRLGFRMIVGAELAGTIRKRTGEGITLNSRLSAASTPPVSSVPRCTIAGHYWSGNGLRWGCLWLCGRHILSVGQVQARVHGHCRAAILCASGFVGSIRRRSITSVL